MPRKKKVALAGLTWSIREALDPGTRVTALACGGGSVVASGERLFRVRPGGWDVQLRALPPGTERPLSLAIEPRPPFRIALGPPAGDVVMFTDTREGSSVFGHGFTAIRGEKRAVELSWIVHEGASSLFARTDDGGLYRMQTEGWDTLELPPIRAIAHDDAGGFAALTVVDGEPKVYVTRDAGDHFHFRSLGMQIEAEPDAPAALALSGFAVAVCVGDSGPIVSRGVRAQTEHHAGLPRTYALAFDGSEPDPRVYVATQRDGEEAAALWLVDAAGDRVRVMELRAEDNTPLDLGPVAWDAARGSVLLSSRAGLLAVAPDATKVRRATKTKPLTQ
jgi:hypothetical protein